MAKPFQITLIPGAEMPATKPGWHRRALAASKRFTPATAPQRGDPRADAKAVDYAMWLADRDGLTIPADAEAMVEWQRTAHGYRPRAVHWHPTAPVYGRDARGVGFRQMGPLLSINLPHWDYEAPAVVESVDADWSPPTAGELSGADRAAVLEAFADADAAMWCAAVASSYGQPAPYAVAETWEPGADLPALPVVGIQGRTPDMEMAELSGDSGELADPIYPLCSDDDDGRGLTESAPDYAEPDASSHPVIVLCLSDKARAALFERIQDGTFPAADRTAKGGAWRLTLADAQDCAGIGSLRFVGLPRKPYTRRPAPPVEAIRTPVEAIRIPAALVSVGAPPAPMVYHAAPQL